MGLSDTLIDLLTEAEVHCCAAFPNGKMPYLQDPSVMLQSKQLKISPCAIANHFGNIGDDVCRAALCEEDLVLQVYSPYSWGGRFCDRTTDRILSIVLEAISDFTFRSVHRGTTYYDPETDCYRNDITISAVAWVRLEAQ